MSWEFIAKENKRTECSIVAVQICGHSFILQGTVSEVKCIVAWWNVAIDVRSTLNDSEDIEYWYPHIIRC